jgi:hypothetical protein
MNRFIYVAAAAAVASGIAVAPAVAGLSHNPSFSHKLPVRVPSGAQTVSVRDEHGLTDHPSASPSAKVTRSPEAEPSDANDDNLKKGDTKQIVTPSTAATSHEAEPEPEPGDDKGGASGGKSGGHGKN